MPVTTSTRARCSGSLLYSVTVRRCGPGVVSVAQRRCSAARAPAGRSCGPSSVAVQSQAVRRSMMVSGAPPSLRGRTRARSARPGAPGRSRTPAPPRRAAAAQRAPVRGRNRRARSRPTALRMDTDGHGWTRIHEPGAAPPQSTRRTPSADAPLPLIGWGPGGSVFIGGDGGGDSCASVDRSVRVRAGPRWRAADRPSRRRSASAVPPGSRRPAARGRGGRGSRIPACRRR